MCGPPTTAAAPGERFAFGANWARFLSVVDEARIEEAQRSLREMLGVDRLDGASFVDVGSGSGLFSLAALRLGAGRVHSFDVDPRSVACAEELRRRYASSAGERWTIEPGSALDEDYLRTLGAFDVAYSWGVLHHTGDMRRALHNVCPLVAPGGRLFISIYNDQGLQSRIWSAVKRTYNRLPGALRAPFVVAVMGPRELRFALLSTLRLRPQEYVRGWTRYRRERGMSRWHDLVDWAGGYPFEVAAPEAIFGFYRERGFTLQALKTCAGGLGCNQFVFVRDAEPDGGRT